MDKKRFIIPLVIIVFITTGCLILRKISLNKKDELKKYPKRYCYEDFRKLNYSNAVLVLMDIKYKKEYIEYYTQVESGIEPILDNKLEFVFVPTNEPVYVLSKTDDGLLSKIIYSGEYDKFSPNYIEGFVYTKTLHKKPPK